MKSILGAPLAFLYGTVITVRNKMFDWGWLRSEEYDIPVICVGNLTVGGTGKTPVTEKLIGKLKTRYSIAVLSRGYRRKTKGYLEVTTSGSFRQSGDEPKQIKLKFPDILVSVCESRREGIRRIRSEHPEVNLILLDDGFQHRYVEPWVNIILMDYNRPIYKDHLLPWGNLRDRTSQLHRAHYVIVTKCPQDINPIDKRIVRKSLGLYPYQGLYFSDMRQGAPIALYDEGKSMLLKPKGEIIAMCGIGNPDAFIDSLSGRYTVVDSLVYPDHHPYRKRDLRTIEGILKDKPIDTLIVTTEKDAVKLRNSKKIPPEIRSRIFYVPISVGFLDDTENEFLAKLENDIRSNPKNSFLHP